MAEVLKRWCIFNTIIRTRSADLEYSSLRGNAKEGHGHVAWTCVSKRAHLYYKEIIRSQQAAAAGVVAWIEIIGNVDCTSSLSSDLLCPRIQSWLKSYQYESDSLWIGNMNALLLGTSRASIKLSNSGCSFGPETAWPRRASSLQKWSPYASVRSMTCRDYIFPFHDKILLCHSRDHHTEIVQFHR